MFVDPEKGSDWNSGLSPDQPLASIAEAMNKAVKYGTGAIHIFPGKMFFYEEKKKKKKPEPWPPVVQDLNEEWWK